MKLPWLGLLLGFCASFGVKADPATVVPGRVLQFPRDHGSHPEFQTEWWYVTGWLKPPSGAPLGFQITFFRSRTDPTLLGANPSAFTARQLLIAHAAISDPKRGRIAHEQRISRQGLGLAEASTDDTAVHIGRWTLSRTSAGYRAQVPGEDVDLDLTLVPTQSVILNGEQGFSQKGPNPRSASYYYSVPHLRVSGHVNRSGGMQQVSGEAWLDHEWSSEYLDPAAQGWDWVGLNLDDGSALMAFRIRGIDGSTHWAGATLRSADGTTRPLKPSDIEFTPLRRWRSPRTGITYPVRWQLQAAGQQYQLDPLMDDQENDTRETTGAIYWEGAVRVSTGGRETGRGYLELTGYGQALKLR